MNNDTKICVRIPTVVYDQLKQIAEDNYLSISAVVKIALAEYIKKNTAK